MPRAAPSAWQAATFSGEPAVAKHRGAEGVGELDRRGADAAGAAMHQQRLARLPSRARSKTLVQTVKKVSGMAPASIIDRPLGTGRHCGAGAVQYSA
jgi:hypothetical protein